jgi:hypothetical protein
MTLPTASASIVDLDKLLSAVMTAVWNFREVGFRRNRNTVAKLWIRDRHLDLTTAKALSNGASETRFQTVKSKLSRPRLMLRHNHQQELWHRWNWRRGPRETLIFSFK